MAADCKSAAQRATEVRILPCAPSVFGSVEGMAGLVNVVDFGPAGSGRMWIALAVMALLAFGAWRTIEPGKIQQVTWILLGFFAFRVVLGRMRSR